MSVVFVHKLYIGVIVGLIVFGVTFALVYGIVVSVNGIADTEAFHPVFFPLLLAFTGFLVPIAGVICMDINLREEQTSGNP